MMKSQKRVLFAIPLFISFFLLLNSPAPVQETRGTAGFTPSLGASPSAPFFFLHKWGSEGSGEGQFGFPRSIAINATGYVYVIDSGFHRVQVFTQTGQFVAGWGSYGSGDGQFIAPSGIAVNATGYVYVIDSSNHRVQVFTQTGQFVAKWGSYGTEDGQFNNPISIAVNATGYAYVAEWNNNRVQVFTQTGQFVAGWGSYGSGDGQFHYPWGIAVTATGHVYITDSGNNRVQVFTQTGQFVAGWGSLGSGDGQFSCPGGIAVTATGHVYITDSGNNRVQVFTQTGLFVAKWGSEGAGDGQFSYPTDIVVNATGHIHVVDQGNHRVQVFGNSLLASFEPGAFRYKWGSFGSGNGQFKQAFSIAINTTGYVYVVDYTNNSIQVFTSTGGFVTKWGQYGTADGQFHYPWGIAVNATGCVYVTDYDSHRVQVFTPTGEFVTKWGIYGTGDGQFYWPTGIAVNSTGHVYVADTEHHRIQVFSQTGQFLFKWGSEGTDDGQFSRPFTIAVNATGHVYIVDNNQRVQVFSSTGQFITKWGSEGHEDGQFSYPRSIAVNKTGYIYVADTSFARVQVFTPTGQFVTKWGDFGYGDGQFFCDNGIALNATGHAYVVDSNNNNVQVFGNYLPVAQSLAITPTVPMTASDLILTYAFQDAESDAENGTEILWYRNGELQPLFNNQTTVPATWTNRSDLWNVTVRPRDGIGFGNLTWITITILNTLPEVTTLQISPLNPDTHSPLVLSSLYSDLDGDSETGTEIRWYQNGELQPLLNDQATVPAILTNVTDIWNATVRPRDGTDFGDIQWSPTVTITNTIPSIALANATPIVVDTGSLAGEFPATYTFAGQAGGPPAQFVVSTPSGTTCSVVPDFAGHQSVLALYDGNVSDLCSARLSFPAQTTGAIDVYLGVTGIGTSNFLDLVLRDGTHSGLIIRLGEGTLNATNGPAGWSLLGPVPSGQFCHLRVEFNCTAGMFCTWVNGTPSGTCAFMESMEGISELSFRTFVGNPEAYSGYVDALDLSWDPRYSPWGNLPHAEFTVTDTDLEPGTYSAWKNGELFLEGIIWIHNELMILPLGPRPMGGDWQILLNASDGHVNGTILFTALANCAPQFVLAPAALVEVAWQDLGTAEITWAATDREMLNQGHVTTTCNGTAWGTPGQWARGETIHVPLAGLGFGDYLMRLTVDDGYSGANASEVVVCVWDRFTNGTWQPVGAESTTVTCHRWGRTWAILSLKGPGEIQITAFTRNPASQDLPGIVSAFDIDANGTLRWPATARLFFDPATLAPGVIAADLAVYKLEGGEWVHVGGSLSEGGECLLLSLAGPGTYAIAPRPPGFLDSWGLGFLVAGIAAPVLLGIAFTQRFRLARHQRARRLRRVLQEIQQGERSSQN